MRKKYSLNNILTRGCIVVLFILLHHATMAQVMIKGPECVLPGISYQYVIQAKWDSSSTMQVCVTGGKLKTGETCGNPIGKPVSAVSVVWDESATKTITVTSAKGNYSLTVTLTRKLNGGTVSATDIFQQYKKEKSRYEFKCN